MENQDFEGIEGIVDDTVNEDDEKQEGPDSEQLKEMISGLQTQIESISNETKQIKDERNEVVEKFSKIVGYVEGAGIGTYDPTTGSVIPKAEVNTGPDPIDELEKEITTTQKSLDKQLKSGDITNEEYYQEVQETITPLKEKQRKLEYDRDIDKKLNEFKASITPAKEETKQAPQADVHQRYNELASEYPDITNKDSQLFQKMNEIYQKNPSIYANANQTDTSPNPSQYQHLIENAALALRAEGVEVKHAKSAIRDKFSTPANNGYQEPKEKKFAMDKNQVSMAISQGITNKSLLSDINNKMGVYMDTGALQLED